MVRRVPIRELPSVGVPRRRVGVRGGPGGGQEVGERDPFRGTPRCLASAKHFGACLLNQPRQLLHEILEEIRRDATLGYLDAEFYPEWPKLSGMVKEQPTDMHGELRTLDQLRNGFYVCNSLIQLMEKVYFDLKLEGEFDHPDNRSWMNLFKHWS